MSGDEELALIDRATDLLEKAQRVLCITGAGVSADSGLPTYRGIGGLYDQDGTEDGIPIEVAMSGQMLQMDPQITWKYLSQIERACRGAQPNAAHKAIAQLQGTKEVCVLTQNVDGFHRKAGSDNLIEMHGCFDRLYCMKCNWQEQVVDYSGLVIPPVCKHCGGGIRPRVVLFGEMLPEAALQHYYAELEQGFDLVMSIGTTSVFPYIAGPVVDAARQGVPTIEINPGDTEVSHCVSLRIRERAAVVLPLMIHALEQ